MSKAFFHPIATTGRLQAPRGNALGGAALSAHCAADLEQQNQRAGLSRWRLCRSSSALRRHAGRPGAGARLPSAERALPATNARAAITHRVAGCECNVSGRAAVAAGGELRETTPALPSERSYHTHRSRVAGSMMRCAYAALLFAAAAHAFTVPGAAPISRASTAARLNLRSSNHVKVAGRSLAPALRTTKTNAATATKMGMWPVPRRPLRRGCQSQALLHSLRCRARPWAPN